MDDDEVFGPYVLTTMGSIKRLEPAYWDCEPDDHTMVARFQDEDGIPQEIDFPRNWYSPINFKLIFA